MPPRSVAAALIAVLLTAVLTAPGSAQAPPDHGVPSGDPVPPPRPPAPPPPGAENYEPLVPDSDGPWGLADEMLTELFGKASVYRDFTRKFTCTELARLADYDHRGEVSSEKLRRYGYLLTTAPSGEGLAELRQVLNPDGTLKSGNVKDEEPFPPAYAWVFLFSSFNEPYFGYRLLDDRFDGFDWVYEIQFKGSLPFTDGKDIRQWEGVALIDAVTKTPLEIRAEPSGQRERIDMLYRRWSGSFNALGMRTAPKPLGYQARIEFRHRLKGLTFPTELRYDTFRAVGPKRIVPSRASTRTYQHYRIYITTAEEQEIGAPTSP